MTDAPPNNKGMDSPFDLKKFPDWERQFQIPPRGEDLTPRRIDPNQLKPHSSQQPYEGMFSPMPTPHAPDPNIPLPHGRGKWPQGGKAGAKRVDTIEANASQSSIILADSHDTVLSPGGPNAGGSRKLG